MVDPINAGENHWYSKPIKKEWWQSHRHEKLSIAPQVHCQYLIVVFVCTWTLNNKGRWRRRRTFICQAMISDRLSRSKLQPSVVHQLRWPFVYFESFTWLMSLIQIFLKLWSSRLSTLDPSARRATTWSWVIMGINGKYQTETGRGGFVNVG